MGKKPDLSEFDKLIIPYLYQVKNLSSNKIAKDLGISRASVYRYKYSRIGLSKARQENKRINRTLSAAEKVAMGVRNTYNKKISEERYNNELEERWEYWTEWYVGETIEESRYYKNIRFEKGLDRVILDRIKPDLQKYGFTGSARKIYDELRERASKLPRPPSILDCAVEMKVI